MADLKQVLLKPSDFIAPRAPLLPPARFSHGVETFNSADEFSKQRSIKHTRPTCTKSQYDSNPGFLDVPLQRDEDLSSVKCKAIIPVTQCSNQYSETISPSILRGPDSEVVDHKSLALSNSKYEGNGLYINIYLHIIIIILYI